MVRAIACHRRRRSQSGWRRNLSGPDHFHSHHWELASAFSIASTTLVPNLNIDLIGGVLVSGTPSIGQAIVATSATAASWQAQSGSGCGSGSLGFLLEFTGTTACGNSPLNDLGGTGNIVSSSAEIEIDISKTALQTFSTPTGAACGGSGNTFATGLPACSSIVTSINPTAAASSVASTVYASNIVPSTTTLSSTPALAAIFGVTTLEGSTGSPNFITGVAGVGQSIGPTGTVANLTGVSGIAKAGNGTGSTGTALMAGVDAQIYNNNTSGSGGTEPFAASFYGRAAILNAPITHLYNDYREAQPTGANNPNPHGYYQAGTEPNTFNGPMILGGISGTSPICGNGTGNALTTVGCAAGTSFSLTVNGGSPLTSPVNLANGPTVGGITLNALNPSGSNVEFEFATGSILTPGFGGSGVANTASITLGTSNQNWATIGTGIVKVTTVTGAISDAASADVISLWSGTCSASTFLRGDGSCNAPAGSGTVNTGTATHLAIYATSTNAVSSDATLTDTGTNLAYTGTGGMTAQIFNGPSTAVAAGPFQLPAGLSSDICGGTNSIHSLLIAQETNTLAPTVDLLALPGSTLNCNSDPFAGYATVGNSRGQVLQGGFTLSTDVPIFLPTEFNWHGISQVEGFGSTIKASATFQTNYPEIDGTGTATLCLQPGVSPTNQITMGTWNGSACVAGGTGTFTPAGPSSLVGYAVGIAPTGATPTPLNVRWVGTIYSVTSASVALMDEQVNSPITAPGTGTGYQYVFAMPVVMPSLHGVACDGTGAACDSEHQEMDHVAIDCNDTSGTNRHIGYLQLYGQEGTKLHDSSVQNCYWSDVAMHGNKTTHSGPYTNINAGKNSLASTVPVSLSGMSGIVGFIGWTIVPNTATTMGMYISNQPGAGTTFMDEIHIENATDGIACGDTISWPWETGGTGCSNVHFVALNGNSNLTNVIHFINSTGTPSAGDVVTSSSKASSPVAILDDIHSQSYSSFPPIFTIGNAVFPDGATLANGIPALAGTLTSPAQSQVMVINSSGNLVNGYLGVNVDPQTGNYTFACPTDRIGEIEFNITAAATLTLPQAGSTACTGSNMALVVRNTSSSTAILAITPTTSTFQPEGSASINVLPGGGVFIYSDAVSSVGNYHDLPIPTAFGGVNVQTTNYTETQLDKDKMVVMNCSGACTLTLANPPPSAKFNGTILSIGSTLATVSLNSLNFNGASTPPTLATGKVLQLRTDGTNYFGDIGGTSGIPYNSLQPATGNLNITNPSGYFDAISYTGTPGTSPIFTRQFSNNTSVTAAPHAFFGGGTTATTDLAVAVQISDSNNPGAISGGGQTSGNGLLDILHTTADTRPAQTWSDVTSGAAVLQVDSSYNLDAIHGAGGEVVANWTGDSANKLAIPTSAALLATDSNARIITATTPVPSAKGGTGVNNTATLTLGSSNVNLATLGTGIMKNTTTTGAITDAAFADVVSLFGSGSCSGFLKSDGTCAAGGGSVTSSGYTSGTPLSAFSTATNITPATFSNVVALFGSGSCSGFLKNDGTCATSSGSVALSGITAAGASNTIANGNNPQEWNFAQTTNSQAAFTFGDTSAATGTGDILVDLVTAASSTEVPLNIAQGSNSSTTSIPALNITSTWNNASLVGSGIVETVTNTTSSTTSLLLQLIAGTGGATTEFAVDYGGDVKAAGNYQSTANTFNTTLTGGIGSASANGQLGGAEVIGSLNSNTGSSTKAGPAIVSAGGLTAATPNAAALEGVVQIQSFYLKGTSILALGDVVCGTTTAFTVTDCSHTGPALNIIGLADTTSNPIGVITHGLALVKFDGTVTLGDTACMGTTADGQAHDNGTSACVLGSAIGVIVADSGTIEIATGSGITGTAMSTTLALVELHISQ